MEYTGFRKTQGHVRFWRYVGCNLRKEFSKFHAVAGYAAADKAIVLCVLNRAALVFASEVRAFKPVESLQVTNENFYIYLMAYGHAPVRCGVRWSP